MRLSHLMGVRVRVRGRITIRGRLRCRGRLMGVIRVRVRVRVRVMLMGVRLGAARDLGSVSVSRIAMKSGLGFRPAA